MDLNSDAITVPGEVVATADEATDDELGDDDDGR